MFLEGWLHIYIQWNRRTVSVLVCQVFTKSMEKRIIFAFIMYIFYWLLFRFNTTLCVSLHKNTPFFQHVQNSSNKIFAPWQTHKRILENEHDLEHFGDFPINLNLKLILNNIAAQCEIGLMKQFSLMSDK